MISATFVASAIPRQTGNVNWRAIQKRPAGLIVTLTLNAEFHKLTTGDCNVATSCIEAATARFMFSATSGWLRIPSGENSDGCRGSLSEGNGFPALLQTSKTLFTDDVTMSRRASSSLDMLICGMYWWDATPRIQGLIYIPAIHHMRRCEKM